MTPNLAAGTDEQLCGVKLYDQDDGDFAGTCILPKGHNRGHKKTPHKVAQWNADEDASITPTSCEREPNGKE